MSDAPNGNGRKLTFEPSISIGNVLTLIIVVGGAFAAYADLASRMKALEVEFTDFKAVIMAERHPPPRPGQW